MKSKRILVLTLVLLLSLVLSVTAFAADYGKVKVNYQRQNKDYNNMRIWTWEGGEAPKDAWPNGYEAKGKNAFGVYFEVPLVMAAKKIGFVIVDKTTEEKDIDSDRFIDLSQGQEVWIIQGDEKVYYKQPK